MTRVLLLGHPLRGDDGAALALAGASLGDGAEVRVLGRPGVGLLDALDPGVPTVLVDVIRTGAPPGTVRTLPLADAADRAVRSPRASSHGLGPADALGLLRALGRPLPPGFLVGVEGERFGAGEARSPAVEAALPALAAAVRAAVEATCTSTGSPTGS